MSGPRVEQVREAVGPGGALVRLLVAWIVVVPVVAAAALGSGAGAPPRQPPAVQPTWSNPVARPSVVPPWPEGRPGVYLDHFSPDGFDVTREARRRRLIALNAWSWPLIERIKAANPEAVVLVYKDLSSTRSYRGAVDAGRDAEHLPSGVGYVEADSAHPEWFLTDRAGRRLEWDGHPGHWHMDVGNPDYQRAWLTNVRAELRLRGWDGVIMDNALGRAEAYNDPGPAKYPDDDAMQAATRSMVAAVAPGLRAEGFLTFANIGNARKAPTHWRALMGLLDGTAEEHFANFNQTPGTGYLWDWGVGGWRTQVDQIATAARAGKIALVKTRASDDVDAVRYGLASYLLASDGRAMFSLHEPTWHRELGWDLGDATGPYTDLGNSVYRRDFTAGTVIVNAASDATGAPATLELDAPHLDHDGRRITSLTLPPTRGAILRRAPAHR